MGKFINSADPDEMPYAAFNQHLHCKGKKDLQTKECNVFYIFTGQIYLNIALVLQNE